MIYFSIVLAIISIIVIAKGYISYQTTYNEQKKFNMRGFIGLPLLSISAILFIMSLLTQVPAGHVGVIDVFGKVPDRSLNPGIHLVNPFAHIEKMSIKTQELKETMSVPSKEGLSIELEASLLFHIDPNMAPKLYREIGSNYKSIIIEPNFRSVTRGITASYEAQALYTSNRELLALQMDSLMSNVLTKRSVFVENVLLRSVHLPERVSNSIEEKLRAEQDAQRMTFVLQKERQEAERKEIEATGIQKFQEIVKKGIDQQLLEWKGIEATQEIAKSPNTKVVIIGSSKNGLPLILGDR
jgi:regulator of protease activity HflC (stomatin/prohibitin superfamily)